MSRFFLIVIIMLLNTLILCKYIYPVKISENRRYLMDQKGTPFLYVADTAWFIFDRLSEEEYDFYLDDRMSKGFTVIQVMAPWEKNRFNYYGELPFDEYGNLATPNEKWWKHVDAFVEKAAKRGMMVNIVPLWLGYWGTQWFEVLPKNDLKTCFEFGQFLGNRFKNYKNVIFTIGGDHDPQDRFKYLNQIALGIKSVMPDRIITAHTWENKIATDCYEEASWLDLNAVYTYYPEWNHNFHVYVLALKAYNYVPTKPFILIESGYENASIPGITAVKLYHIRREIYWAMLCGATGFAYGNSDIWQFSLRWKEALNDPGVFYVKHAVDLFKKIQWWRLIPDQFHEFLIDGYGTFNYRNCPGGDDYVTAAFTKDRKFFIAYIPHTKMKEKRILTIDTRKFSCSTVKMMWFDPTTGHFLEKEVIKTGKIIKIQTPGKNSEGDNDWILIMEGT